MKARRFQTREARRVSLAARAAQARGVLVALVDGAPLTVGWCQLHQAATAHATEDNREMTHHLRSPERDALPVSVIIPAYNRELFIRRALESVSRQLPHAPAEIVVVDDGSDDRTAVLASGLGAKVVRHAMNRGPSAARNSGMRAAMHPWVAFLDSDDEWFPHHLATLWAARNGHVLVSGSCLVSDPSRQEPTRVIGPLTRNTRVLSSGLSLLFPENFVAPSAVLLRRDLALQIGGYNESLRKSEDLDLWIRMLEHGSFAALPDVSLRYRIHAEQAVSNAKAMRDSHGAIFRPTEHTRRGRRVEPKWLASNRWDNLRAAQREGDWRRCLSNILRLLSPTQVLAVGEVLLWRYRARRLASRYSTDGSPSVAILAGSSPRLEVSQSAQRVTDLRATSSLGLVASLVLRPPGTAVASTRWQRWLLRLLRVREVGLPNDS
jgi:glycosyltransferase involved in cell wall biosynthesis